METMKYQKKTLTVKGKSIAYVDEGQGDPIVFLHGNPTSSYLWRNVMPELEGKGRLIAPDLVGQGDSEQLPASEGPERYSFDVAYDYLSALLQALDVTENVTLVIHDWGSALGFHWANNNRERVKAIAYMEGIVMPVEWDDWPESARGIFQGMRSPKGEELVMERNMFIEGILPSSIIRKLSDVEMNEYRRPFMDRDNRQLALNWPRSIPIGGEPKALVDIVTAYGEWLKDESRLKKLFINAEPGSILVGRQREFCRSWPNQTEVTVKGLHFIQEDSGPEIGQIIAGWL